jgi:hypothetical protein
MRKSIKKIAASLLAATMVLGTSLTAFGYETADGSISDVDDGENVYVLAGNMTGWNPAAVDGIFEDAGVDGVVKFTTTFPAYSDDAKWASRFGIIDVGYDDASGYDTIGTWARILLGEPSVDVATLGAGGYTCLTNIRVACEEETEATVYFDTRTYTVYIEDAEGNAIDYLVSWVGNDDDEEYLSVSDYASLTLADYTAKVSADRQADLEALTDKITGTIFTADYAANVEGLGKYVNGGDDYYVASSEEEPTTGETTGETTEETTAATTAAATTAATTASNQATKTGDVAPVALMVTLCAAVAVVAVVAKKKEA